MRKEKMNHLHFFKCLKHLPVKINKKQILNKKGKNTFTTPSKLQGSIKFIQKQKKNEKKN